MWNFSGLISFALTVWFLPHCINCSCFQQILVQGSVLGTRAKTGSKAGVAFARMDFTGDWWGRF